jgi:hypothetical protein
MLIKKNVHAGAWSSEKYIHWVETLLCGIISGSQNGAVARSMFEINISACHLRGHGFDSRSDPFLIW